MEAVTPFGQVRGDSMGEIRTLVLGRGRKGELCNKKLVNLT